MYRREELTRYSYFEQVLDGHRISDVLDSLTGLISKTHMSNFVRSLIKQKIPFTFGIIDLDNFKYINDTYGHSIGDEMLKGVANDLRAYLGDYGIAGRFGGDEFLFVNFRDLHYDEKKKFCQQLFGNFTVLRKSYKLTEYELFITGTAGLATYPNDADNYTDLFGVIDKVLYRGKSKGRNCYIIYLEEKHKDIEIIRLKKNSLYATFRNLAAGFDSSDDLYGKLRAGFESLKNDLHITNMYYASSNKTLKSVVDRRDIGQVDDIDQLMKEELYATNDISQIKEKCPRFYRVLEENEIEAFLVMKVNIGNENYGYLMFAEPHTLRIWQENEYAIMFLFARMLGEYVQGMNLRIE